MARIIAGGLMVSCLCAGAAAGGFAVRAAVAGPAPCVATPNPAGVLRVGGGPGASVTAPFVLPKGVTVATVKASGTTPILARLLRVEDDGFAYIADAHTPYQGRHAFGVVPPARYVLAVNADDATCQVELAPQAVA